MSDLWRDFFRRPSRSLSAFCSQTGAYLSQGSRPSQPHKDSDLDKALAVVVAMLGRCNVFDIRFIGLHHNTVRGAAGVAILTAELLKTNGYLWAADRLYYSEKFKFPA